MADSNKPRTDQTVEEPENSTVDDWFGQNVAEDQETADQAVAEAGGNTEEAERLYRERADGKEKYDEGHKRP
jgi:hypothetical protein